MIGLGVPENNANTNVSRVFDISENQIAVGEYLNETPIFYKACIYTIETGQFVNLKNYLLELGMSEIEDWDLVKALCISDDGSTIAGYGKDPSNNWTGWVLKIMLQQNLGDLNGDGEISMADVLLIVTYLMGASLSDEQLFNADMDSDLQVNIFDILLLVAEIIE